MSTFDEIPENLYIAILETIFFHAFGSYLVSRTLKQEFLATIKSKKASTSFRSFLHTLPEGVVIVDDAASSFEFVNSRLKSTLNVQKFVDGDRLAQDLARLQQNISLEFDQMMSDLAAADNFEFAEHQATIRRLLGCFRVAPHLDNNDGFDQRRRLLSDDEDGPDNQHDEDVDLGTFLGRERKTSLING